MNGIHAAHSVLHEPLISSIQGLRTQSAPSYVLVRTAVPAGNTVYVQQTYILGD